MFLVSFLTITAPARAGDKDKDKDEHRGRGHEKNSSSSTVPINSGIAILLVAGIAFGTKKLMDINKRSQEANTLV